MESVFKGVSAALFVTAAHLFGSFDYFMKALITLVIIDYFTGLAKAWMLNKLSPTIGLKGIVKKVMYFAIVAVAVMADTMMGVDGMLRAAVIGFLFANEALSILENCAAASLPVPKILIKVLEKFKQSIDDPDAQKRAEAERKLP